MDYLKHFARDPKVCGGAPVVKGTRVTLQTVLASLTEGASKQKVRVRRPAK